MGEGILGVHHVTALCADAQANVDFYAGVLGLRVVKLTVNFDDPGAYHLYYGDGLGRPGTVITFFPYPAGYSAVRGVGQITTTSLAIPVGSTAFWEERLARHDVSVVGRIERMGSQVLAFSDPDGLELEFVEVGSAIGQPWEHATVPVEHAIHGIAGATLSVEGYEQSARLLTEVMGLRQIHSSANHFRFALDGDTPLIDLLCQPDGPPGRIAKGAVHHIAFRLADEATQLAWRARLVDEGFNVSPVMDRQYFQSIYFREPGGVLFELATDGPGFTVDEAESSLGGSLKLPPMYESARPQIEALLPTLKLPEGVV